jgi:glutathione S-transferase
MMTSVDCAREAGRYRLFGSVGSPYALKLRAILRYQRLPFDWIPTSLDWVPQGLNRPPLSEKARQLIADVRPHVIPVVYFPHDRSFHNDSTLVAYKLDRESKERSIIPPDPGLAFLSHLLEDMADEWGVKIAFHYRWACEQDRAFKSRVVTGELLGAGFDRPAQLSAARHFAARQVSRMPLVGCTPENAPLIEKTFRRILAAMDRLLEESRFMFGTRPVLADFGWYGQLISLAADPTPWVIMRDLAPGVFPYLQSLEDASGVDEPWPPPSSALPQSTTDLLSLAGEVYLPFLQVNAAAHEAGRKSFTFSTLGMRYSQDTFKYQVKCLNWLQQEFRSLQGEHRERAAALLKNTGCLTALDK